MLIEQLRKDEAVMAADTLMLTIPNQLGPEYNLHVLEAFAEHVAPALSAAMADPGEPYKFPVLSPAQKRHLKAHGWVRPFEEPSE